MKIKLLDFKEIKDFPSGSGIEYYLEKVYVVGDDAKEVLVLNKTWKKLAVIPLFTSDETRIPKKTKPDLEATAIVEVNGIPRLLILGSGSKEPRNKAVLVNLDNNHTEETDITVFYDRLKNCGFGDINIESATLVLGKLIIGNRGNKSKPDNHVIVTDVDFYKHQGEAQISPVKIEFPDGFKEPIGLSGMTFSHLNDWIIATFSTEDTDNAIDDGAIGDSYLAIIENASSKILRKRMKVNQLINIGKAVESLQGYKMESVCVQSEKDGSLKLQLVADNDDGVSCLFKVRLKE
jgi:hypothetical protein